MKNQLKNSNDPEYTFKKVSGTGEKLDELKATLMLSESQKEDSITLKIMITNAGKSIEINNPMYYLQFMISDVNNRLIELDKKAPIPLINKGNSRITEDDLSFNILSIQSEDGDSLDISTLIGDSKIFLKEGSSISYDLKLEHTLQKGQYKMQSLLSFIYNSDDYQKLHISMIPFKI